MSRFFNGQLVELLAPAGNFEIFKEIIHSGADAVYLGGKCFNMRLHKKDFNLTNEKIKEAVEIAHALGKKVYITLNNILNYEEIEQVREYLEFLASAKVDAVLANDMGIVQLINEMNLDLDIHSSVMMNVHNIPMINTLKELGVTRIVASRNMDLNAVKDLHSQTGMEIEYFTHGDLCFMNDSQCLYSGVLFGQSSNRGLCLMPCRWGYDVKKDDKLYPNTFPLSSKDMCLYENIPELINAGVSSFKIEGRMRDAEYLLKIINAYSRSIDNYINDPIHYDRRVDSTFLSENRHRDLTTGFAFGKPGLSFPNNRNTVNGKNFATKKFFSVPVEERETTFDKLTELKNSLQGDSSLASPLQLSLRVNSFEQALVAIEEGVDRIYLAGDVFEPKKPFTKEAIQELGRLKGNSQLFLALPRMTFDSQIAQYNHLLQNELNIDGILVTNLGALSQFKPLGLPLLGDSTLNIYNGVATKFYKERGLEGGTVSLELKPQELLNLVKNTHFPLEIIAHGSPTALYMEHDLYENIIPEKATPTQPNEGLHKGTLFIVDENGYEHPVYKDQFGKNHMLFYKDLCLLPLLKELAHLGISTFRIEGVHYTPDALRNVIQTYKKALADLDHCDNYMKELTYRESGFTLGALHFSK